MANFKLTLEYDGTAYSGWQRQAEHRTVQAEVERALAAMTRHPVTVLGAGRTDAGVHALGQVASFRVDTRLTPEAFLKGLNSLLPPDIAVRACTQAAETFHARFDASDTAIALLFVGARLLNALSHLGAAWLAGRIGLVNTMVFT